MQRLKLPQIDKSPMMTREEAAFYLNTTPRQIDRLRAAGKLRWVKIGKRGIRILRSSVEVKEET